MVLDSNGDDTYGICITQGVVSEKSKGGFAENDQEGLDATYDAVRT